MTEEPLSTVAPFPGTVPGQHQAPRLLDRVRIAILSSSGRGARSLPK
ncbi:MAG TPA: hypothetical protein VK416_12415 [Thermoanaerobaculia bacterium]|nr:hypothetical protein [Thermoanaerobaculia bacterium]